MLYLLNKKRKIIIENDDIFGNEIKISILKKIDEIFQKGLSYYIDPTKPLENEDTSIFFRKEHFGSDLNLTSKQIVNKYEELKNQISAYAKLTDFDLTRKIKIYTTANNPRTVASEIRGLLYPNFSIDQKKFLKNLIAKFAEFNILVFEYVESPNKIEKINVDGFFLKPDVIVIRRNRVSYKREIFTLAHELGHYLLDKEEIEEVSYNKMTDKNLSSVEKWCNDFAFYFLIGDFFKDLDLINFADRTNDYHTSTIEAISQRTHLSFLAIYTRLLYENKISGGSYATIKKNVEQYVRDKKEKEEAQKLLDKERGAKPMGIAKPINSPLLISALQNAYYEGIISEFDVCKTLKIKTDNFNKIMQ